MWISIQLCGVHSFRAVFFYIEAIGYPTCYRKKLAVCLSENWEMELLVILMLVVILMIFWSVVHSSHWIKIDQFSICLAKENFLIWRCHLSDGLAQQGELQYRQYLDQT